MNIYDFELHEIEQIVKSEGYRPYRAVQLFKGLYDGHDLENISVLPKQLILSLKSGYNDKPLKIIECLKSVDGTSKFLLQARDNNIVESVLIPSKYGNTLCVSTQIGCAMGCAFCASTKEGLIRNLSTGEIANTVICANNYQNSSKKRRIKNIVLMGSGEPLHNFDNVVKFLKIITHEQGFNISIRNISLSTCGIVPKIYSFADMNLPVTLSCSLHSPFDEVRQTIMPVAKQYTVKDTVNALKYYFEKSGRRIIIEYVMIRDVNVSQRDALKLKEILSGLNCHINLIHLSAVSGSNLKPCTKEQTQNFVDMLQKLKLSVTVRRQMGADIEGACGQLKRKYINSIHQE